MNINTIKALGRCCNCGNEATQHLPLPYYAPKASGYEVYGWGCIYCEIDAVGAFSVLCDDCTETYIRDYDYANPYKNIKNVVVGYSNMNLRMTLKKFLLSAKKLEHNMNHHIINVYKTLYYCKN